MEVSTSMARHSRVKSSIMFSVRMRRPSASWSLMKSMLPALIGARGQNRFFTTPAASFAPLAHRNLEPLLPVDPVDALMVVIEALTPKHVGQHPVAPPAPLPRSFAAKPHVEGRLHAPVLPGSRNCSCSDPSVHRPAAGSPRSSSEAPSRPHAWRRASPLF